MLDSTNSDPQLHKHHNHWWQVLGLRVWHGNQILPSFSIQWKSDESTKQYLTQILLVINWRYWQERNIHACVWRFKVALCKPASLKSTRVLQTRNKVGYFSNGIVYTGTIKNVIAIFWSIYCFLHCTTALKIPWPSSNKSFFMFLNLFALIAYPLEAKLWELSSLL